MIVLIASRIEAELELLTAPFVEEEGEPGESTVGDLDTEILGRLSRRWLPLARGNGNAVEALDDMVLEVEVVLGWRFGSPASWLRYSMGDGSPLGRSDSFDGDSNGNEKPMDPVGNRGAPVLDDP